MLKISIHCRQIQEERLAPAEQSSPSKEEILPHLNQWQEDRQEREKGLHSVLHECQA